MNEKFSFQKGDANKIENRNLDCRGCVFAYADSVSECVMFNQKPLSVLKGNSCKKKMQKKKEG